MPLRYYSYPILSLAKVLLRPFVNSVVYNSSVYKALWSFASFAITNVGFTNGVLILLNIRRYIFGVINLPSLSNNIYNYNPIAWGIFELVLKPELKARHFK